jgi:hypothetical protein
VLFSALATLLPDALVLRVLTAGLALAYLLYLLQRSGERVGRLGTIAFWALATVAIWLAGLGLPAYLLAHVSMVWLARSLYFHSSLLAAGADLGLALLGLAAAVWAGRTTGSVFLAFWCFFLVQALFIAIPARPLRGAEGNAEGGDRGDRFQNACRVAEAALTKLSSHR